MNGEVLLNLLTSAIEAMVAREGTRILGVKCGLSEDGGIAISVFRHRTEQEVAGNRSDIKGVAHDQA